MLPQAPAGTTALPSAPSTETDAAQATGVVICADDAAWHPAITEAVIELAGLGRISAASAMVHSPHWPRDAARLARLPQLDLGLHLNLTEPLDRTASVRPLPRLIAAAWLRRLDATTLRREIDAQIGAFAEHAGRLPDHIDGHQHVHQFPGIRDVLLERVEHWWPGAAKPWLRVTRPAPAARSEPKAALIYGLGGRAFAARVNAAQWPTNRAFIGVYGFDLDAAQWLARCRHWLGGAGAGAVWMVHPARERIDGDAIAAARVCEYEVLRQPAMAQLLSVLGLRVVRGSERFSRA